MNIMGHIFKRLRKDEDGAATVEFVIVAPLFFMLFFWIIETGFITFHAIQLDRGVDIVVRDLMLDDILDGRQDEEAHDFLKQRICSQALLSDCIEDIKLEVGISTVANAGLDDGIVCVDRTEDAIHPVYKIDPGQCDAGDPNATPEIMFMRACLVVDPILPVGVAMPWAKDESGGIQLLSSSAFVNEPC
ncbi:hypothetical protein GCM10008927_06930 [Amylibacter ulvae]|uniref:TadE-like domain-containing protein n=2 Tax=Paramylibacter ulvae TaxID=1651968 RepID=A0ABQ3D017_9RHOB|nr:hypothetical protein GCM10008927_06930 [Amylibacter ulvae]